LLDQLPEGSEPRSALTLRKSLESTIESLRPQPGVPAQSHLWRIYETLHYRYIQQCGQQEVADQLGLSLRQLKREQRRALQVLAQSLNERFGWSLPLDEDESGESPVDGDVVSADIKGELAWLGEAPTKAVDLREMLPVVIELAQGLATQHQVELGSATVCDAPAVTVHRVALRQILLSLLSVAICRNPEGHVRVAARQAQDGAQITISGETCRPVLGHPRDAADLAMAQELVKASGGVLVVDNDEVFTARLGLPAAAQWPILVIDDNADAVRLLERYVSGTRYRVVGLQNAQQALGMAVQVAPKAIILDVMMPDIDGWELLGRIRQHPLTAQTPVIACTILAQEELARSLGISEFLRKPFSRESFLAVLDRLAEISFRAPR
jgi:CheY-like chemotaxis protein